MADPIYSAVLPTQAGKLASHHSLDDVCNYDNVGTYNSWWQMVQKNQAMDELIERRRAEYGAYASSSIDLEAGRLDEPDDIYRAKLEWIGQNLLSPTAFADLRTRCTPTGAAIAAAKDRIRINLDRLAGADLSSAVGATRQKPQFRPPPSLVASPKDASAFAQTTQEGTMDNGINGGTNGGALATTNGNGATGFAKYQSEFMGAPGWQKGGLILGLLGIGYTIADLIMWKRAGKGTKKLRKK